MDNIHGDAPGLSTPVDEQKQCVNLSALDAFRSHTQIVSTLNVLDAEAQALLASARRIRAGLSDVHRAARNPVAQQTREEWLQAYDRAPLKPHRGGV